MNFQNGIEKMKLMVSYKNNEEKMNINNGILHSIKSCGQYIKPKIFLEDIDDKNIIRSKLQFKIYDNVEFIIETECLDIAVICCSYLNHIGADYKSESTINLVINEKLEDLAVILTTKFPDNEINENICGIRDPNREQYTYTLLNFSFTGNHNFNKYKLSNETLSSSLNKCTACYLGDFIDKSKSIIDNNVIEINKDELVSIKFKKDALELIEAELQILNTYFNMDIKDVEEFVMDHNGF